MYGDILFNISFLCYFLVEFYCNVLGNFNYEIFWVMVVMYYEIIFVEWIVDLLFNKEDIFLKDILLLEFDLNIFWFWVLEDKIGSYELFVEFLYEFGKIELKRFNKKLVELVIVELIYCLEWVIKDKLELDVFEIDDEMLKMEICF